MIIFVQCQDSLGIFETDAMPFCKSRGLVGDTFLGFF